MEKNFLYSVDDTQVRQTSDHLLKENVVTPSNSSYLLNISPLQADLKYQHQPSVLYRYLNPVVDCLIKQSEAEAFREPVDSVKLKIPDYFDIVKNPMDLSTIRRKLHTGQYRSGWEFIDDVWLMFENAWLYNKKTSRVYKDCTKLASIFKRIINDPMIKLGYCCGQHYLFDPKVLFCVSKKDCIIPKFKLYWNYKDSYNLCKSCYEEIVGDLVIISNFSENISIKKYEFIMKYNNSVKKEPLIGCFHCGIQQHKICALYLEHIWKDGFLCNKCCILLNKQRVPNKFRAKNLNRFKLDSYIEDRVRNLLKNKGCNSEVIIRLVHNSRKSVIVKEAVKSRFVDAGIWPEQFPYSCKVLLAFQQIDNSDVCFFSMFVQEYDSFCPQPNGRCVYISYLDSIHFFTPKEFRTQVYHEILLGYLDFVKNLGYRKVHIWACPPKEGEDFVFYCHPSDQKIPSTAKLLDWYKVMLDKAIGEKIVKGYKDIYTQAVEDKLQHVSELPYFDGDFLPITLEQEISKLNVDKDVASASKIETKSSQCNIKKNNETNKKRKSKKGRKNLKSGKNTSCYSVGDPLTDKILSFLQYYKEGFLVIHLNYSADIPETSTIKEVDPEISSGLMCSRESFLEFCRENDLEFCSLRRSKYSTIVLLYELHKENMDSFFCNLCKKNLETGFHCKVCKDFDLCSSCYDSNGHGHKMEILNYSFSAPSYKNISFNAFYKCRLSAKHASKCKDPVSVIYQKDKPLLKQFITSNEGSSGQRSSFIQSEYGQKSGLPISAIKNSCNYSVETSKLTKDGCYYKEKVLFPAHSVSSELHPLDGNVRYVSDIKDPKKDTYCISTSLFNKQGNSINSEKNSKEDYHGFQMLNKSKPYLDTNFFKIVQNPTNASATSLLSSPLSEFSFPTSKSLSYLHTIPMNKISSKRFNSDLSNAVLSDKSVTNADMNFTNTTPVVSGVSSSIHYTSSGKLPKLGNLKVINSAVHSNKDDFTSKLQDIDNNSITKVGEESSEFLTNKQDMKNCQTKNIQPEHCSTVTSVVFDDKNQIKQYLAKVNEKQRNAFSLQFVKLKSNKLGFVVSNSKTKYSIKLNKKYRNTSNIARNKPNKVSNKTLAPNTDNSSNYNNDMVGICKPKPPVFVSGNNYSFKSEICIQSNNKNVEALNEPQSASSYNKNNMLYPSLIAVKHHELKNDETPNENAFFSFSNKPDCPTGVSPSIQQTVSLDNNKISSTVTENKSLSSPVNIGGKYSSQIMDTHSNRNVAQLQQVNFFKHTPITSHNDDLQSYIPNFVLNKNEVNKCELFNQNTGFDNQPFECNKPKSSQNDSLSKSTSQNSKGHVLISRTVFGLAQSQTQMSLTDKLDVPSLQHSVQNVNELNTFDILHQSLMETSGNVSNRLSLFQQSSPVPVSETNNNTSPIDSFLSSNTATYNSNSNFPNVIDSRITTVKNYTSGGNTCFTNFSLKMPPDDVWSKYNVSNTATQNKNCSFEPYNAEVKSIDSYETVLQKDPVSVNTTYLTPGSNKISAYHPLSYPNYTLPSTLEVDKFVNLENYAIPNIISMPTSSCNSDNLSSKLSSDSSFFFVSGHLPYDDLSNKNNNICDNNGNISNRSTQYESSLSDNTHTMLKTSLYNKESQTNLLDYGSILVQNKSYSPAQLKVCLLKQPDDGNLGLSSTNYPNVTYSDKSLVENNYVMKLGPELKKRHIFRYTPCSKRGRKNFGNST